ncbi:MAG: Tm-1-like ATP-binding domain-containing protein [Planctomycetes bacterium]|nr:Tm-1-like ATP-binding domain-containing protein [Planctomycetota bacterium]
MAVHLLATLDTKGEEAEFVRRALLASGVPVVLVDTGCLGEPRARADVTRDEVFLAAGTSLAAVRAKNDRGEAVTFAAKGAEAIVRAAHAKKQLDGVLGLGGGAGTTIGTAARRALPLGVPKVMVSTLASGQVAHYVGTKDVFMLHAVTDIAGLNRISRAVLSRAAQAMAGMAKSGPIRASVSDKPLVAASMFGVTTPCVERARAVLEEAGYEVLVFHATGSGGRTLEALAESGMLDGVLDVTTTELADELVGGVLSAGPERLTAAGQRGVPQVVSVGALDMVNFHARDTVPAQFASRRFYQHNANVTLMRTTPAENKELGRQLGAKLAAARGPAELFFPLRGASAIDKEGQPFDDPAARKELLAGLRATRGTAPLHELDLHINDAAFAEAMAQRLIELMRAGKSATAPR